MQEERNRMVSPEDRKARLKLILIVHLLIVLSFFVASFLWGKLE